MVAGLPYWLRWSYGQDFSNKGKTSWVIYTGHIDGTGSRMALYITSDQNATGTVSVAGSSVPFYRDRQPGHYRSLTNYVNPIQYISVQRPDDRYWPKTGYTRGC